MLSLTVYLPGLTNDQLNHNHTVKLVYDIRDRAYRELTTYPSLEHWAKSTSFVVVNLQPASRAMPVAQMLVEPVIDGTERQVEMQRFTRSAAAIVARLLTAYRANHEDDSRIYIHAVLNRVHQTRSFQTDIDDFVEPPTGKST